MQREVKRDSLHYPILERKPATHKCDCTYPKALDCQDSHLQADALHHGSKGGLVVVPFQQKLFAHLEMFSAVIGLVTKLRIQIQFRETQYMA